MMLSQDGGGPTPGLPRSVATQIAEFRLRSVDGVVVFEVEGELDLSNADALAQVLEDAVARQQDFLLVDLSAVGFIDSSGIRALFAAGRRLGETGRQLRVVVPPDRSIRRTLLLTEVPKAIPLHDSLDAAMRAISDGH